jgi:hypothetical protein
MSMQASFDLPLPRHRRKRISSARERPIDAEALRDAADIRQWTDGARVAPWRIYRLAQAFKNV